jgi:hypothetical protein
MTVGETSDSDDYSELPSIENMGKNRDFTILPS